MTSKFTRSNLDETSDLIFEYISEYITENGYAPSVRDICDGVGVKSTSTVHTHLKRLEDQGRLTYETGKRRAIKLIEGDVLNEDHDPVKYIPLIGTVTAGVPILANEQIERMLPLSADLFPSGKDMFMLKVRGDSMIDAAILDGDYVVVKQQRAAALGDIIVALLGEEATVKRLISHQGRPYLQPENEAYDIIPFYSDDCQILGRVVGVFRTKV